MYQEKKSMKKSSLCAKPDLTSHLNQGKLPIFTASTTTEPHF
jgi:hypothetical protein